MYSQLLYTDPLVILQAFAFLWIMDCFIPKNYPRWFILHIISNTLVCIFTVTDVWFLLSTPYKYNPDSSHFPRSFTLALHAYHIIVIRDLTLIDWIHHVVMNTVLITSCFFDKTTTLANYNLFFSSGLPGGVDYILLVLLKIGNLNRTTEKYINSKLNVWIRGPGIVIGAYITYLQYMHNVLPNIMIPLVVIPILIWNAQYFTERVVYNYGVTIKNTTVHV